MFPTVLAALAETLRVDAARPLVTFYDLATGERVELSVKTFDNWVSKVANFVVDELMLDVGDTISFDLPCHWQTTVTLMGAWRAGLAVAADSSSADLVVVGPKALDDQVEGSRVLATSLRPLGGPFEEALPDGWLDFAREVPPQPDALLVDVEVDGDLIAIEGSRRLTHADLVQAGSEAADRAGLRHGGRLLTNANPAHASDLVLALVAPLVVGGSVVLVANAPATGVDRVARQEGVTAEQIVG